MTKTIISIISTVSLLSVGSIGWADIYSEYRERSMTHQLQTQQEELQKRIRRLEQKQIMDFIQPKPVYRPHL